MHCEKLHHVGKVLKTEFQSLSTDQQAHDDAPHDYWLNLELITALL